MPFTVLVVCTGNICRSPMAERLLRHRLGPRTPIVVGSAGSSALVGRGMDAPSAARLRALGGDPDGHVARRLTPDLVGAADLVLTASARHRSDVVQLDPELFRSTFTLREFARLGAALGRLVPADEAALRWRVAQVAAQRGFVGAPGPQGDDIADPFGAPAAVVEHSAQQVSDAVDGVIAALGVGRPRPTAPA